MPVDYKNYPNDWDEIRDQVLLRAGGDKVTPPVGAKCEWCDIRNYAVGYRDDSGGFVDAYYDEYAISWFPDSYEDAKITKGVLQRSLPKGMDRKYIIIVLTIAHIDDPDPMNCNLDNLAALCQKCHNTHDAPMRARNRKINAGQMELF